MRMVPCLLSTTGNTYTYNTTLPLFSQANPVSLNLKWCPTLKLQYDHETYPSELHLIHDMIESRTLTATQMAKETECKNVTMINIHRNFCYGLFRIAAQFAVFSLANQLTCAFRLLPAPLLLTAVLAPYFHGRRVLSWEQESILAYQS